MCLGILPICMSLPLVCAWYPYRPEEGIKFPKTGATDSW